MKSLKDIIDEALAGVDITPEQKGALMDMYVISYYKILIELVTTIGGEKKEYHQAFNNFITSVTESFSPQQKEDFEKIVREQQSTIFKNILTEFNKNLPEEIQVKIKTNLTALGLAS
jgi:hypothetical protein